MTHMHILVFETETSPTHDKARLSIEFDPDNKYVSLSINEGDEFDFDADELLRALNAVFMFRKSNST